jgi:hypothetical protein
MPVGNETESAQNAQEALVEIGGQGLAYGLEIHLRGNSKVLGRIAILLFDEGGVLQRRKEAPACGRRPDSDRR